MYNVVFLTELIRNVKKEYFFLIIEVKKDLNSRVPEISSKVHIGKLLRVRTEREHI